MAVSRILPTVIVLSALMAGCSSTGEHRSLIPLPWHHKTVAHDPRINPDLPALPPAGSGRGGYYQDDGPGDNPPAGLLEVPDAEVKYEPYAKYANRPYEVLGQAYTPLINDEPFTQRGMASWYGVKFNGQRTSSGEIYDMYKMTAAHPTLPIPSYARVTSLESGKSVIVRINDRGPFHSDRVIDLSYTAALKLGLLTKGSHQVQVERLFPNDPTKVATARREAASRKQAAPAPAGIAALMLDDRLAADSRAPAKAEPKSGFYLQLGSYSRPGKAEEMSAKLVQSGLAADSLQVSAAGAVNRLLRGPFETRAAAQRALRDLPAELGLKPIIVRR
ncbi:MAG: septal ring lytic transglycosylase RlpA family protein [Telluria sp.]